jgi:phage terminase large subunit GpA-like protein
MTAVKLPKPIILPEVLNACVIHEISSLADWAEDRYILPKETAELAGPWSHDYTPYLLEPMRWLSDLATRQVTVCACTQSGKTELSNILIGRTVDVNPAPTLIVMPRENDANRRLATRLRPMFKSTPSLLHHLGGKLDNLNIGKETILDNMILYIAWSNSPAAMADNPVCIVILDEAAKFPQSTGKEADPYSLAKKRQRTFRTRSKLLIMSSPVGEGDIFDAEFLKGDKNEWHAKCPCCGVYNIMRWPNIELDKDKDGNLLGAEIYRLGNHARYVCPACRKPWDEYQRWDAVSSGRYAPAGCSVDPAGQIVGDIPVTSHHSCRITALMMHPAFQTIDDLAGDWAVAILAKKVTNIKPLQDFINSQLAEPWKETEKETSKKKLRFHIGTYRKGTVPTGVQMLSCGVDIQMDHVWVSVDGWGYLSEVWSIFEDRLETGDTKELENLEVLRRFLNTTWLSPDDPELQFPIYKIAIDVGYRPDVIKDFCSKCTELSIVQVRGDDSVRTRPFRAVKIAGGTMTRYDLNVNEYKNRLYRLLFDSTIPGPGYWHLNADTTDETLSHLTAEEQRPVRTRRRQRYELVWVLKKEHLENHLWDAKVYSSFAAELCGAHSLPSLEEVKPQRPKRKRGRYTGFLDDLPDLG